MIIYDEEADNWGYFYGDEWVPAGTARPRSAGRKPR